MPPKKVHRVSLENVAKGHPLFQRMSRKKSAVTLLKERSTSEPRGIGNNKKVLVPHTTDQAKEIIFHDAVHGYDTGNIDFSSTRMSVCVHVCVDV